MALATVVRPTVAREHVRRQRIHGAYARVADGGQHRLLVGKQPGSGSRFEVARRGDRDVPRGWMATLAPSAEATVQDLGVSMTAMVQEPPCAGRPHHVPGAVEHDLAVVVHTEASKQRLQLADRGQAETQSGTGVGRGFHQIEELRPGYVARLELRQAGIRPVAPRRRREEHRRIEDAPGRVVEVGGKLGRRDQVLRVGVCHCMNSLKSVEPSIPRVGFPIPVVAGILRPADEAER